MSILHIGERRAIKTKFTKPSKTRQDMAHLCDINVIVAKTQRNEMVLAANNMANYGDFTLDMPYDQMLEQINEASERFYMLPAKERRRYGDDPAAWLSAQEEKIQAAFDQQEAEIKEEAAAKAKAAKIAKAKKTLGITEEPPKENKE